MAREKEVLGFKVFKDEDSKKIGINTDNLAFARAVFDSVVDGAVGFDRDLKINSWNRPMELHYNITRSEAEGRLLVEIVPELDDTQLLEEVLKGHSMFLKDRTYVSRQGTFQAYLSPVTDHRNRIIGGIAMLHDNTEMNEALGKIRAQNEKLVESNRKLRKEIKTRKKAEEKLKEAHDELEDRVLKRTAQLSAINEELNEFAYVISHDLKAPLRAISSLSEWIAADYSDQLDLHGRESLQLLNKSVARMDKLIRGVLSYYRLTKPGEKMVVRTKSLVLDLIEQMNLPANIKFEVGDLPDLFCEEITLLQVFQNLIDNSIKFNDKVQPEILIGCKDEDHQQITFWVKDNGRGIKPSDIDRIFMLFQTAGTAENATESSGIGLSVVKKIINRIGGTIWVESEPGAGSTFYFRIPTEG